MSHELHNALTHAFILLALIEYFHLIVTNERGKRPKWLHFIYMFSWVGMLFFGILLLFR